MWVLFSVKHISLQNIPCVPYPIKPYTPSSPFFLIYSNIWGPLGVNNIIGSRRFIKFIVDHSRACWLYLLKEKSETKYVFQKFHQMIKTRFKHKYKCFALIMAVSISILFLESALRKWNIWSKLKCWNSPIKWDCREKKSSFIGSSPSL